MAYLQTTSYSICWTPKWSSSYNSPYVWRVNGFLYFIHGIGQRFELKSIKVILSKWLKIKTEPEIIWSYNSIPVINLSSNFCGASPSLIYGKPPRLQACAVVTPKVLGSFSIDDGDGNFFYISFSTVTARLSAILYTRRLKVGRFRGGREHTTTNFSFSF